MNAKRILILAQRVIRQLAADRRTVVLILIGPLVVLTVAGVLLRTNTGSVTIGVVLQDQGATLPFNATSINLGQRIVDSLGKFSDTIHIQQMDANAAEAALDRGDLDAILTLPADFSQQSIANRSLTFSVQYEGSNPTATQLLGKLLSQGAIQALASLSTIASQGAPPEVHINATYRYGSADFDSLDYIAPVFIGLFVFMFVFILTSVAFLRERAAGTLERLQATPIRRIEIVLGYMCGFAVFALLQSVLILAFTIFGLKVHYLGSLLLVFGVELLLALMAVNLGIFFSTFARNEFQVVQFIPLVVVTQIFLSGAIWAIKDMPSWLQPVARLMPLTYANEALRSVMIKNGTLSDVAPFMLALIGFAIIFAALAAQTVRRQT